MACTFGRISFFLSLLASTGALAYQPLVTDDTGTQGVGGNQLELSYAHARSDENSGTSTTSRSLPFVYTRGITDNLDLYAGISYLRFDTTGAPRQSGLGNPVVGAKWRFYEQQDGWSIGFKPEIQLPVSADAAAKGLGLNKTSYSGLFIFTRETGFGEFHVNAAYAHVNDDSGAIRKHQYRLSAAPVWKVAEKCKVALDLGVLTNPEIWESAWMQYALLGVVYSPADNLDFAIGYQKFFNDGPDTNWQATAGLTWRFR